MLRKGQTGGLLRRFRSGPEVSCRVRRTLCRFDAAPPQSWGLGGRRGAESKGPCVLAPGVPLRYSLPGWFKGLRDCPGMRVTRGDRRTGLSVFHLDDCPKLTFAAESLPGLPGADAAGRRLSGHWKQCLRNLPSPLCTKAKSAFLLDRARPVSLRPKSRPCGRLASDARLRA